MPKYLGGWVCAAIGLAMCFLTPLYTVYISKPQFWSLFGLWLGAFAFMFAAVLIWLAHQKASVAHWAARSLAILATVALAFAVPAWLERKTAIAPFTDQYPALVFTDGVRFAPDGNVLRVIFPDIHVVNASETHMAALLLMSYRITEEGSAFIVPAERNPAAAEKWLSLNGYQGRRPLGHPLMLGPGKTDRGFISFVLDQHNVGAIDRHKTEKTPAIDASRVGIRIMNGYTRNWGAVPSEAFDTMPKKIEVIPQNR